MAVYVAVAVLAAVATTSPTGTLGTVLLLGGSAVVVADSGPLGRWSPVAWIDRWWGQPPGGLPTGWPDVASGGWSAAGGLLWLCTVTALVAAAGRMRRLDLVG